MIKDIKLITHMNKDVVNDEDIEEEYVEFTVIGKTRTWINWLPVDEFKEKYPNES